MELYRIMARLKELVINEAPYFEAVAAALGETGASDRLLTGLIEHVEVVSGRRAAALEQGLDHVAAVEARIADDTAGALAAYGQSELGAGFDVAAFAAALSAQLGLVLAAVKTARGIGADGKITREQIITDKGFVDEPIKIDASAVVQACLAAAGELRKTLPAPAEPVRRP